MRQIHLSGMHGWDYLSARHMPAIPIFLLYALPLSIVPPLMLYYAGTRYDIEYLSLLRGDLLQGVCVVFFLAEQVMVLLMGAAIQRMGETLLGGAGDFKPSYEDSFKLAAIAATPLWLAPLFLLVPNLILNLAVAPLALLASAALIFQGVPAIFKIGEKDRAALFSSAIVFAGIVGWATMIYTVVLAWSIVRPL